MYELKQSKTRILITLLSRWRQHAPPQIGINYTQLMEKVYKVEVAVSHGFSQELLHDRLAVDMRVKAGLPPTMAAAQSEEALKWHARYEQAVSKDTAAFVLRQTKDGFYSVRGLLVFDFALGCDAMEVA